jgi:hypothetical protein
VPPIGGQLNTFRLRSPRDLAGDLDVMCQVVLRIGAARAVLLQKSIDFHVEGYRSDRLSSAEIFDGHRPDVPSLPVGNGAGQLLRRTLSNLRKSIHPASLAAPESDVPLWRLTVQPMGSNAASS